MTICISTQFWYQESLQVLMMVYVLLVSQYIGKENDLFSGIRVLCLCDVEISQGDVAHVDWIIFPLETKALNSLQ
jgi:hypothetical protein